MSVLNQSGEEPVECPLCMEPLEVDDLHFYPCTCGYQICRFCWNRIREGENGLCPACRKAYPENPADFTPLSQEQVAAIKTEKKAREQKRRNKTLESRRALANVRVVQNNLVFVVGLPVRLADPEILKRQEYFGKYGKIHKVVINQSTTYAGTQFPQGPSASAYVTYVSMADALRAIQGVNNVTLDGRVLKGSLGTTKYCANFMKNQPCPKPDCMYLHELGDPKASFTKEEMHAGLHQVYERKLHNQLAQATRDKPQDKTLNGSGNSSANESKSSAKDGNQSNFIPTTVVTSSHINVVNSSKSKKEQNGSNSNGIVGTSNGKEAWPSLGSSPPNDSPARKQPSPKPQQSSVKSQENGTSSASSTSESSSPTQLQTQQAQTKTKHTQESKTNRNKENGTNGQKKKDKSKQKSSNSFSNDIETDENKPSEDRETKTYNNSQTNTSVFENDSQYLTNELDELESDRHSLLENHDLLDNSDHSLLEDDNTHNLLNDANNEVMMMQRHREMLAGLVENNHMMPHMKSPVLNGYGLLDRDMGYLDRQISQISQGLMDQKDVLLREQSQSELLMRQNDMLSRQHNVMVEPKHYMPTSSIGLESASELLGANFHQNQNMLPPFGMRVDNSMGTSSIGGSSISAGMSGNMSVNMSDNMSSNMANMGGGYMLHGHQMLQNPQQLSQTGLLNGYGTTQSNSEGRYLAENMDKFFTDFHKAQQLRLQLNRGTEDRRYRDHLFPQNMLSAERLEMEHKQRMNNLRPGEMGGHRASGDGDDDLDFDPFKETQKAFAAMETEMMQNQVSSGDNMDRVRRTRLPPPGFNHISSFGLPAHNHHTHQQGYLNNTSSNSSMYTDWTQMDPAIMAINFSKNAPTSAPAPAPTHTPAPVPVPTVGQASLTQQELFARFNQLGVQPNGVKHPLPGHWQQHQTQKLSWTAPQYNSIPLPPGFAPAKSSQHPAECIDAK